MTSINSAIDYFVAKKFGIISTLAPTMASLKPNEHNVFVEKNLEIEEYKVTLRNMPENELLTLHIQSLAKDAEQYKRNVVYVEKARLFNLPSANADFLHWSKAEHWTIDEAVALSFGKDPLVVTWKVIEPFQDKSEFAKEFSKRRDLAKRASKLKLFGDQIPPIYFLNWAEELDIKISIELINEVAKYVGMPINWHQKYIEAKSEYDLLVENAQYIQKPDSTRKTENLLQALVCIAIDEYGYKAESEKSTAPKEISEALARQGKQVDPKTIRSWLKEGITLLPSSHHKD